MRVRTRERNDRENKQTNEENEQEKANNERVRVEEYSAPATMMTIRMTAPTAIPEMAPIVRVGAGLAMKPK